MAKTVNIIRKALQNAGIWVSESEAVPGDYLMPCMNMLSDIVSELNAQSAIVFEQVISSVSVVGSSLLFNPYTAAEQSVIDGGGTVDITDRMIDFVPIQAPTGVSADKSPLKFLSLTDVATMDEDGPVCAFAFVTHDDSAEMIFNAPVKGTVRMVRNKPIVLDADIVGELRVPAAYDHFIVTKLAEAVSLRYQFSDSASLFAQKSHVQGNALANNVTSARPITHETMKNLNRFRG